MFPKNKYEVLALEWLKRQDNSSLSPAEFLEKYEQAKEEMFRSKHPEEQKARISV